MPDASSLEHPPPQDRTAQSLDRVAALIQRFDLRALRPALDACRAMIHSPARVEVAVLGRFKAGKTSLINRLVGRDVLPVDVLPATAVVTTLAPGPRPRAAVRYLDGRTEAVELDQLADFATERGNPHNVRRVAAVEVELPEAAVLGGIRLVDTPGVGSIHAHNTRGTLAWLPRVSAAAVAISVEHPLGSDDLALLRSLAPHTPEIVILLTKADWAPPEQLARIEAFTREQLQRHGIDVRAVVPVSTRPGGEATLAALTDFLRRRYVDHADARARDILNHKLDSLRQACRAYLELTLQAARAGAAARAALRDEVREALARMNEVDDEFRLMVEAMRTRARTAAEACFLPYASPIVQRLRAELTERLPAWRGPLVRELERYRAWLSAALARELESLSAAHTQAWQPLLDEARSRVNRTVQAFRDRFSQRVERLLGRPFAGGAFEACVEPPRRPDVHIGRPFDTPLDLLGWLIPMTLVRPLIHRRFRRALAWETQKNLHRLASQWAEALIESIDAMTSQAERFMRDELEAIDRLSSGENPSFAIDEGVLAELT